VEGLSHARRLECVAHADGRPDAKLRPRRQLGALRVDERSTRLVGTCKFTVGRSVPLGDARLVSYPFGVVVEVEQVGFEASTAIVRTVEAHRFERHLSFDRVSSASREAPIERPNQRELGHPNFGHVLQRSNSDVDVLLPELQVEDRRLQLGHEEAAPLVALHRVHVRVPGLVVCNLVKLVQELHGLRAKY
jgi:hypothetical protein